MSEDPEEEMPTKGLDELDWDHVPTELPTPDERTTTFFNPNRPSRTSV